MEALKYIGYGLLVLFAVTSVVGEPLGGFTVFGLLIAYSLIGGIEALNARILQNKDREAIIALSAQVGKLDSDLKTISSALSIYKGMKRK